MNHTSPSDIYAEELGGAVRALVAPGAVIAAALAAMLTLTGATHVPRAKSAPVQGCMPCLVHKASPTV